ncbi:MAG: rhodanese-like domain-containing protein [Raineya sp.]|jgi:rhodanese-related sulfurtransferase|nr:rhodanese-like domain-containing protein [Raineya sp.]
MAIIKNADAIEQVSLGNGVIIDVREPAEFKNNHIAHAFNLPSTKFSVADYEPYKSKKIYLVCQSGNRASQVLKKLENQGFENLYILEEQMESFQTTETYNTGGWSVDRQFRFVIGVLLGIFLGGYHYVSPYFMIIPVILCLGFTITSLLNKCYMRMGIAMLPWNKGKKVVV